MAVAAALIQPLARELPYAMGVTPKRPKKKKKREREREIRYPCVAGGYNSKQHRGDLSSQKVILGRTALRKHNLMVHTLKS